MALRVSVIVLRCCACADSVASFISASSSLPVFKIVPGCGGDGPVLSCDVLEVVDAHGLDENIAVTVIREAVEGLSEAHFGRSDQVRLVVLAATLLAEVAALRHGGLTPWALRGALRLAEDLAMMALERLAAERLAVEVLDGLAHQTAVAHADGDCDDVALFLGGTEDAEDDISQHIGSLPPPVAIAVEMPVLPLAPPVASLQVN
jgi:hypothetical protein